MNNAVFGKLWKMSEKKDTLNLPQQQKQEKLFSVRTKVSYYKVFHRKLVGYRNEKNSNIY